MKEKSLFYFFGDFGPRGHGPGPKSSPRTAVSSEKMNKGSQKTQNPPACLLDEYQKNRFSNTSINGFMIVFGTYVTHKLKLNLTLICC